MIAVSLYDLPIEVLVAIGIDIPAITIWILKRKKSN